MRISTKGRYGIRALIDLASHGGCVSLKSVAERQGLSENYLERLIASLKKAGFVKSVRGAQGGYVLDRRPEDISVAEILRSLEGPLYPADCLSDDENESCGTAVCEQCVMLPVWRKIYYRINDVIESISLSDLLDDYKALEMGRKAGV